MTFSCPHCGQHLAVETMHQGQAVKCPQCGQDMTVPETASAFAEASADRKSMARSAPQVAHGAEGGDGQEADGAIKAGDAGAGSEKGRVAPVERASLPVQERTGKSVLRPEAAPPADFTQVKQTLQSNIDRGAVTITKFMADKQLEGGVSLDSTADTSASQILTDEKGRKYELGDVVAKGGMGAILDAKDLNLRRHIAMKVLLDPKQADKDQILRFIEEAQVTSQLEHPSVVPVHELAVDASGNVFYTMKLIKGRTLKDVLKGIRDGDTKTIQDYPLTHLLTIYQKVCDAMAFAHSKHVIHRDLKPENIMVGEYGEVQVMDWGLAKVLPRKARQRMGHGAKGMGREAKKMAPPVQTGIDSVRKDAGADVLKTMDGAIMGTPGYMAPEQAMGEVENLDERTDIYALGAILYAILTLHPPVKGKNFEEFLAKVTTGEIEDPRSAVRRARALVRRSSSDEGGCSSPETGPSASGGPTGDGGRKADQGQLTHLPGGEVPDSLSAVAMKALALKPADRYWTVQELQKDIEAYQTGFATGAEKAGAWRQLALLVRRHKAVSVAAAVIIVGTTIFMVYLVAARSRAVAGEKEARQQKVRAEEALLALRGTAPALVAQARTYMEARQPDKALETIRYALQLDGDNADYRCEHGHILQSILKLEEASVAYQEALKLNPKHGAASVNLTLCRQILEENKGQKTLKPTSITRLSAEMRKQQRFADAMATIQRLTGAGGAAAEDFWRKMLQESGVKVNSCKVDSDGLLRDLGLSSTGIADLSPLKGMPLTSLNLTDTKVSDLSPLKGMALTRLAVGGYTPVSDLSPLKDMPLQFLTISSMPVADLSPLDGMPLTELLMHHTQVSDLSPLRGMPLRDLDMSATKVSDLSPLKGMPLRHLDMSATKVSDLSPLKGMPLIHLKINDTRVTDLSPLKDIPLKSLRFTHRNITKGIEVVREMKTIERIGETDAYPYMMPLAGDFWKKYDAGEFK